MKISEIIRKSYCHVCACIDIIGSLENFQCTVQSRLSGHYTKYRRSDFFVVRKYINTHIYTYKYSDLYHNSQCVPGAAGENIVVQITEVLIQRVHKSIDISSIFQPANVRA